MTIPTTLPYVSDRRIEVGSPNTAPPFGYPIIPTTTDNGPTKLTWPEWSKILIWLRRNVPEIEAEDMLDAGYVDAHAVLAKADTFETQLREAGR